MSSAALFLPQLPPLPSSSSSCSDASLIDVKIWEELHLHSLIGSPAPLQASSDLHYPESESLGSCINSNGSSECPLLPLAARSVSDHIRPSNPPDPSVVHHPSSHLFSSDHQQLPVVQVIQTGSMTFVAEDRAMQPRKIIVSKVLQVSLDENLRRKLEHLSVTEHQQKTATDSSNELVKGAPEQEPYPKQGEEDNSLVANGASEQERDGTDEESEAVIDALSKAKFLRIASGDPYSAPVSPPKSASAVPFKWEEAPGKPKPCTELAPFNPSPSLQLPPRLLHRPDMSPFCRSPSARLQSKLSALPVQWSCPSPRSLDEPPKAASPRNLWHSLLQSSRRSYREDGVKSRLSKVGDEDSWSPTSILVGPRDLSSSSSTSSGLDPHCPSPASPEVQSALIIDEEDSGRPPVFHPAEDTTMAKFQLPDLGPAVDRSKANAFRRRATDSLRGFMRSCRLAGTWRSASSESKRNHEESEMWAPTLATYFHSMELERVSSGSGQFLLDGKCEDGHSDMLPPGDAPVGNCPSADVSATNCCEKQIIKEAEVVGSADFNGGESGRAAAECCSHSCSPSLRLSLSLKNSDLTRRRPRRWVLRKLRRSTRLLAAICRAVVRRSITHGKSKRRKQPYHQISWRN